MRHIPRRSIMKILFVATVDNHIISHHLRIIRQLHERGHQVDVASKGDYTNADIHHKFDVAWSRNPLSMDNLKAYQQIKEILSQNQYDIISCHTPISSFFTRFASRHGKAKVIYTAHGFHFFDGAPLLNRTIYKTMERIGARFTDVLVTINEEDYQAAQKFHLKTQGRVVWIFGVGVDLEAVKAAKTSRLKIRSELGLSAGDFLMLSMGDLNENKNQLFVMESLLDAFKKDIHLQYILCGKGPLESAYREFIIAHGLEKQIHLLGYRTDVLRLLYGVDLYLSPSLREGLPVSVMQAMAAKVPVVASSVRGNRDLIAHEKNGLLYPLNNKKELIRAVNRLRFDQNLNQRLTKQAAMDVQKYDAKDIDPEILSLYAQYEKTL